jgi:hypothetical protein
MIMNKATSLRAAALSLAVAVTAALGLAACGGKGYEFDEVSVGQDGDARTPKARSNSQFIRSIYTDLLGRAPEAYDFVVTDAAGNELTRFPIDEQLYLVSALDGINDTDPLRAVIAAGLTSSPEAGLPDKAEVSDPAAFITEQFHRFLGRDPGSYELAAFVAEWNADEAVNPRTIARALIVSREYQSQ